MSKQVAGNRIEWIDNVKGFLMLCICLSHFGASLPAIDFFTKLTGNVWVPCFIFLSGMLFKDEGKSFPLFLDQKTKSLLKPYGYLFLLFTLLDWNLYRDTFRCLTVTYKALLFGQGPPKASPLWFVLDLFICSILFFIINKCVSGKILKIICLFAFSFLGYYLYTKNVLLVFNLNTVFSSILFFGAGYFLIEIINRLLLIDAHYQFIVLLLSAFLLVGSVYLSDLNPDSVLGINKIHNYILFYCTAFTGIFGIIGLGLLSTSFEKTISPLKSTLQYIAKNSLAILAAHCYILYFIDHPAKLLVHGNEILFFILRFILLAAVIYYVVVPLSNNRLYFLFGKKMNLAKVQQNR